MRFWPTAVIATFFMLQACSGGGGNNSPGETNSTSARPELLAGSVHKGVVRRANIEIFELDATGNSVRNLGVALTDENGAFQSPVPAEYAGGPVKVVATAINNQTTMVCDVMPNCGDVAFGSELPLDTSFSLTALLPSLSSSTVQVNLNPFSDLAYTRVQELGPPTPGSIAAANSEVSNLFAGLDVVHSPAVNLANLDTSKDDITVDSGIALAVLNSALARIAFDKGISVAEMLNKFRASFPGGIMQAGLDATGSSLSMQEIVTAARQQFADLGLRDTLGVLVDLQTDIDVALTQGAQLDPVASPNAGLPALERGRAMVGDLRTWGYSIANSPTQADTFFSDHSSVVEVLLFAPSSFTTPITHAVSEVKETVMATGGVDGTYDRISVPNLPSDSKITLITEPDGTKRAEISNRTFIGSIRFPAFGTVTDRLSLVVTGTVSNDDRYSFYYPIDIRATFTKMNFTIQLQNPRPFDLTSLPSPEEIVSLIIVESPLSLSVTPLSWGTSARHRYLKPGIFTGSLMNLTFNPAGQAVDNSPLGNAQLSLRGSFQGEGLEAFKLAMNMEATFNRTLENNLTRESGEFSVSLAPSDLSNGGLQLTLAGRGNRTGSALPVVGVASATLAYQGKSLRVEAIDPSTQPSLEVDQPSAIIATMTNQDGARLVISGTEISHSGELIVDGTTVGTVSRLDNGSSGGLFKISYIDGTFESLN